jgi:hypothetical protein
MKETVNNPHHYNFSKVEVIEIIDAFNLDFYLGNVVKYVSRYGHKNGLEDLNKADWYLNRFLKKELSITKIEQTEESDKLLKEFLDNANFNFSQYSLIKNVCTGNYHEAHECLVRLMKFVETTQKN